MSNIEKNVMRRVRTIHMLQPFFSMTALASALLVLALWGIGKEVWVAKVFSNSPHDFFGHIWYLTYAFNHTRLIVQVLSLTSLGCVVYLAYETANLLTRMLVLQEQKSA